MKYDRVDSVKAMQNAMKHHPWPDEISQHRDHELAMKIYRKYQRNKPFDAWFDGDLLDLAELTKITLEIDEVGEEIDKDGYVVLGGKSGNTPIKNPLLDVRLSLLSAKGNIARRLNLAQRYKGDDDGPTHRKAGDDQASRERDAVRIHDDVEQDENKSLI